MEELLKRCNTLYNQEQCCHDDPQKECNCYNCLHDGFYIVGDKYDCIKKLYFYVMNYIPSYSSEVIYYLFRSKIFEKHFIGKKVEILSMGCGCCPELIAILEYIKIKKIDVEITYKGVDFSPCWDKIRNKYPFATFEKIDLTKDFSLKGFDIVFMIKFFSTLYKNKNHLEFLDLLQKKVSEELQPESFLIYNDINSRYMGRDLFDGKISPLFEKGKIRRYYFNVSGAYSNGNFIPITPKGVLFEIPEISISPLPDIGKTVFFEFQK